MEVLIATEILEIHEPLRAFPEMVRDVARILFGEPARLAARDRLHVDVHPPGPRLHERERLSVGRDAEKAAFGVAEEVADRNRSPICRAGSGQREVESCNGDHEAKESA